VRVIAGNIYFRYIQSNFGTSVRMEYGLVTFGYDPTFITDAIATNIHNYPGFRKLAESYDEWAMEGVPLNHDSIREFRKLILQRVAELEREDPNPVADVMWCGVR
jgi:hypothetical protein